MATFPTCADITGALERILGVDSVDVSGDIQILCHAVQDNRRWLFVSRPGPVPYVFCELTQGRYTSGAQL